MSDGSESELSFDDDMERQSEGSPRKRFCIRDELRCELCERVYRRFSSIFNCVFELF